MEYKYSLSWMLHWVTCTPRILALKQHLSSSAFLLFLQTGSLVKALPTGSNWGLVCHHCHKPHVGLEHLVSERVVVKPFSDDICYNNKKPERRVVVLCEYPLHCHRAPLPGSPGFRINDQPKAFPHFTFFSSASCSSVNACSPEFSYQNLRSNQSLNQM